MKFSLQRYSKLQESFEKIYELQYEWLEITNVDFLHCAPGKLALHQLIYNWLHQTNIIKQIESIWFTQSFYIFHLFRLKLFAVDSLVNTMTYLYNSQLLITI